MFSNAMYDHANIINVIIVNSSICSVSSSILKNPFSVANMSHYTLTIKPLFSVLPVFFSLKPTITAL